MILRLLNGLILFYVVLPCSLLFLATNVSLNTTKPATPASGFYRSLSGNSTRLFAHRGSTWLFPQNTLFAFQNSAAMGADVLDLDVRLTKDGKVVVVHDESILRVAGKDVKVADSTYQELLAFDFGFTWTMNKGKSYPYRNLGIKILLLEDLLSAFPNALVNIELKIPGPGFIGTGNGLEEEVCRLLRAYQATKRVIVMSFSDLAWFRFRKHCPEVPTAAGPLASLPSLLFSLLRLDHIPAMFLPFSVIQPPMLLTWPSLIDSAHAQNIPVHVWTVDVPADIDDLHKMNVDGIMSDRLDVLLASAGHGRSSSSSWSSRGGIVQQEQFDRMGNCSACDPNADEPFRTYVQAGCKLLKLQ